MGEVGWKIGGDQGEGIDSTGDVVATVANRLGYHIYGYKSFSSRIKGGHTHYKVRIADHPVRAASATTQVLVALTQETIDRNSQEVSPGGAVVADLAFSPSLPEGSELTLIGIPMAQIARQIGNPLTRNMVAVGASAALLHLPMEAFSAYVSEKFERKGAETVSQNVRALGEGHAAALAQMPDGLAVRLPEVAPARRLLLTGNQAVALGAVRAGCRIMAAYPITPATDIMEQLVTLLPPLGGVVCQMEDEIAAITLVIGAGYAGVRAMTATSGPGFSLMQEGMGLAASAEVPAVIVDCQRAGPSTGMPTKNEQSDIMAAIFGGHGGAARVVLAPGTPEQAYRDIGHAFNLAEAYHLPVIVASDLSLGEWLQTVDDLPYADVSISRGSLISQAELLALTDAYSRYQLTASGVSPRSLPGQAKGQYLATGVEHLPSGKVSEDPQNRRLEMDKREQKLSTLSQSETGTEYLGPERSDVLVITFGSTVGPVDEAVALAQESAAVARLQIRRLWPFPAAEVLAAADRAAAVLFVEQNGQGQLAQLAEMSGLHHPHTTHLRRYDGTLFLPSEILSAILSGRQLATAKEVS
ncbi:MAG: 2-oxoacid:acceptor oxidoreductase subunit alpha [Sulfobacillus sp.]